MQNNLIFLGTGAGCGVPSFFCDCVACQEAASEPRLWRSRCSLLIQGEVNILIDAPPELRAQLMREKITSVDYFLLTHSHYDHTGGLGDLEFYVRVRKGQAIPAYMTPQSLDWFHTAMGFMEDCLYTQTVEAGWQIELDGFTITMMDVSHHEGTLGLLIQSPSGKRTAYIPDTGPLPAATLQQIQRIDTLILGTTFNGANWMPETHLSIDEGIQIGKQVDPGMLILTHLSMHHDTPITNRDLEAYVRSFGENIAIAYDGLRIEI